MSSARRRRSSYASVIRYHINTPKRRTTITLDKIVSDLIAIKLKIEPCSPDTHSAVRKQLEEILLPYHDPKSRTYDPSRADYKPSELVTRLAVLWLVDKRLSDKYEEYLAEDKL